MGLHGSVADAERRGDIGNGQVVDESQHDTLALSHRQGSDRGAEFAVDQVAFVGATSREANRVATGDLLAFAASDDEASNLGATEVDHRAAQVGGRGSVVVQPIPALGETHKGVLGDLLGEGPVTKDPERSTDERVVVRGMQSRKRISSGRNTDQSQLGSPGFATRSVGHTVSGVRRSWRGRSAL